MVGYFSGDFGSLRGFLNELQPSLGDVSLRCVSRVAVSFVVATADAVSSVEFKFPGSVARKFEMAVGGTIFIDVEGVAARCSAGLPTSRQVALTRRCVSSR